MSFKEIIKEEMEFAKYEYQVKFKAEIAEADLIRLGAFKLGTVFHEDRFFIPKNETIKKSDELIRIRKEGEEDMLFTYKGPVAKRKFRNRLVVNKTITNEELAKIKEGYREIISLNKKRTIFVMGKARILIDKVDQLGSFVEFDVDKESDYGVIDPILKKFDLDPKNAIKLSYFELALIEAKPVRMVLYKMYYKLEKFAFGVSSAVMTIMGMVVGLVAAHQSAQAVLGGIASVGIADSMSDALGVYTAKKSERGSSERVALRSAMATFWSKLIFSVTFLLIFATLPLGQAVNASVVWGLIILTFVNFLIAYAQEEKILWNIFKNVGLAVLIILLSYWIGSAIAR